MNDILYKKLFEVHLLHDYFLTGSDNVSFFSKTRSEREIILNTKQNIKAYEIGKYLEIKPSESTKKRMSEYKLKMTETSLGFLMGIEVNSETVAGGTRYKPVIELPLNLQLNFLLKVKDPSFLSISNIAIQRKLPSIYYFSNKGKEAITNGTPPSKPWLPIVNKALIHQIGLEYEMGAIINFGGTVKRALQHTNGSNPLHWEDLITDFKFITIADKILLPKKINIPIQPTTTQFKAVLEDSSGIVKSINKSINNPSTFINIDFSKIDEADPNSSIIRNGNYRLKITESTNPELVYEIRLDDELYSKYLFGAIGIDLSERGTPFSLLDNSGFLVTRIDTSGNKILHPIFELRFENRKTYWRYQKENGFTITEINDTSTHLRVEGDKLVSRKPKGLTNTLVPFINGTPLILPLPDGPSIKVENDRIFSEIFINQSNRLLKN